MKAVTILLLTTVATFLIAADVIAQENDSDSSLIGDTIANFVQISTADSSSGIYPDAENPDQPQTDGILTSFLTGPIINNFVQTVFTAVELKLNFLVALRRIFSYENVRACLLNLRKFLNLVLRLCTLINKYLPEAELDTNGLSALISYYPSKIPDKYGVPATNNSSFVPVSTTAPSIEYGIPAKPSNEYGAPAKPPNEYGVPAKPSTEYGVPSKPSNEYGVPAKPSTEYGVPAKPSHEYGVPIKPSNEYGVPAKPTNEYGVPAETPKNQNLPTQPPFDFKFSPTPLPENEVFEDDDEDDDKFDIPKLTPEHYKVLSEQTSKLLAQVRPSVEYGVPARIEEVTPADEDGIPHEEYGVPNGGQAFRNSITKNFFYNY